MVNPSIQALVDEVTKIKGTSASAVAALNGVSAAIQVAVDKALENGATAEQLLPVTQAIADLDAVNTDLSNAIAGPFPV